MWWRRPRRYQKHHSDHRNSHVDPGSDPPATVFDAALRYDMAHLNPALHGLMVKFNVANLFDKSYIASCYSTSECNFAVRRNLYASASYDW